MPNVQMTVPEGMSPDQFQKLVNSFVSQRASSQVRGKAQAEAIKELKKRHLKEYDDLVESFMPKAEA